MMKHYNFIFVVGDLHDHNDIIPNYIRDNDLDNCAIIVAGDFGIGFDREAKEIRKLKYLNDRLKNTNSDLFVVRGNHDDPAYFTGKYDLSNLKLVPDYTVLTLNLINILCVGGAYSIDRRKRKGYSTWTSSMNWWVDESFVYDHDKVIAFRDIDVVVTHSAPNIAYPYTKGNLKYWANRDPNLLTDCRMERAQLTQMWENLCLNNYISQWYYGHMHLSHTIPYLKTKFIALDINEFCEIKL